jgi:hypothetical protein
MWMKRVNEKSQFFQYFKLKIRTDIDFDITFTFYAFKDFSKHIRNLTKLNKSSIKLMPTLHN